jgi:hypothetical protein
MAAPGSSNFYARGHLHTDLKDERMLLNISQWRLGTIRSVYVGICTSALDGAAVSRW